MHVGTVCMYARCMLEYRGERLEDSEENRTNSNSSKKLNFPEQSL